MVELLLFVLGSLFGSFANVCIRRLPYRKSIVKPPSHCPKCLIPIRWRDNIPILSFLLLKGKCRNCHTAISPEYPVVEFLTGIYFLVSYLCFGISTIFFISVLLGFYLIVISFIDIHLKIIPDVFSVSLLIIGLILSPFNPVLTSGIWIKNSFLNSLSGAISGGLLLYLLALIGSKIYKKEVMGGGDIKLISAGGSFLGINNVFTALFIACCIGGFTGLILIVFKKKKSSDFIPFGPYISLGILIIFFASHF
ncbi:MAG: prepilin peptidase [Elusimicrobia bacterium]|nr:prepilin peptidase [Elusimicrobiota bacterium]